MVNEKRFGFGTQAVHAGQRPDPMTGSRAVPIYQTTRIFSRILTMRQTFCPPALW